MCVRLGGGGWLASVGWRVQVNLLRSCEMCTQANSLLDFLTPPPPLPPTKQRPTNPEQVVGGDLDSPSSLQPHLARVRGLYCHAFSGDAASADPAELARARSLAQLLSSGQLRDQLSLVVYNSSAGRGSNAGISQVGRRTHSSEGGVLKGCLLGMVQVACLKEPAQSCFTTRGDTCCLHASLPSDPQPPLHTHTPDGPEACC